jgi:hypothetical protein
MANVNAPFGLLPVMHKNGNDYSGKCRRYYIPSANANAFYIGSPVISAANADANGVSAVDVGAAGSTYRGVVVGVEPVTPDAVSLVGTDLALSRLNVPASKTRDYYVYVADDPDLIFECQGDATGTNQVAANANKNAQLTITAPSDTTRPYSATVINSATIATTQAHNIKLLGLAQRRPAVEFGAYAVWLCVINQHELQGNTAGI